MDRSFIEYLEENDIDWIFENTNKQREEESERLERDIVASVKICNANSFLYKAFFKY